MPAFRRRNLLRAAGVSLALPMLESRTGRATANIARQPVAQRFVCVGTYLGFYQKAFFPKEAGFDYQVPDLLKPIEHLRQELTVFSGLDHRAGNGHKNWSTFLTGQKLGQVSLDQLIASKLGGSTRFASLQTSAGKVSRPMNYTEQGVPLPMIERPSVLYKKLFASPEDTERLDYLIESGQSALDHVLEEARHVQRSASQADRVKLDEYFAAIRDVEVRLQSQHSKVAKPVPKVDYHLPQYDPIAPTLMLECEKIMYDLIALALQTDSSRVITMNIGGLGQVFTLEGRTLRAGYHALSHHGNDPEKIRDLILVEREHMRCVAGFLDQLRVKTDAEGRSLLDSTIFLLGTGMGDASRHANQNLPTLVAGGGLRHGQHIAIDRATAPTLLGDLYITLMQQLGIEVDTFSNANRNMNEYLL